jgi:hypothetical protein
LFAQQNSGTSFTASLWYASQSALAPTFTWTGAAACAGQIWYYSDPAAVTNVGIGANSVSTGSTSTHTSTSINTTYNKSLVALIDD